MILKKIISYGILERKQHCPGHCYPWMPWTNGVLWLHEKTKEVQGRVVHAYNPNPEEEKAVLATDESGVSLACMRTWFKPTNKWKNRDQQNTQHNLTYWLWADMTAWSSWSSHRGCMHLPGSFSRTFTENPEVQEEAKSPFKWIKWNFRKCRATYCWNLGMRKGRK